MLYQKVIRAPAGSTSSRTAFLLDLVAYLQCVFRLPDDLPMPYEIIVPSDEHDDGASESDDGGGGRAVLIIDSPLSRDPYGARMEVEVIGIFPENGGEEEARAVGPTMAMVALKKRRNTIDDDDAEDAGKGSGLISSQKMTAKVVSKHGAAAPVSAGKAGPKAVDWAVIASKLPFGKDAASAKKRKGLFRSFDPNGNGLLSLAEADMGVCEVLQLGDVVCKAVIMRASYW